MSNSFQIPFTKQTFDENTLRILYEKHKTYLIPVTVIIISVLLFFFAIVPQTENFFSLRTEAESTKEKIVVIKSNIALLSAINQGDLNSKLQTVTAALPVEKDFSGILRIIAFAAQDASVKLGDFSFAVGNLSSESTKITNVLPIEVDLTIGSDILGTKRFLEALNKRFPLSEVTSLHISGKSSAAKVIFYYKPLPQFILDDNKKMEGLSQKDEAFFTTLSLFKSEN